MPDHEQKISMKIAKHPSAPKAATLVWKKLHSILEDNLGGNEEINEEKAQKDVRERVSGKEKCE